MSAELGVLLSALAEQSPLAPATARRDRLLPLGEEGWRDARNALGGTFAGRASHRRNQG